VPVRIDAVLAVGAEVALETTVLTTAGVTVGFKGAVVATETAVACNSANPDAWLVDL
jgi:hypothetical protein